MAKPQKWVVTLSRERPLIEVCRDIDEAGFKTDRVLEEIGVVTGEGGAEVAERLRRLAGVAEVSPDEPVDLGPPDSPTTW